jgi:FkbM family methyltransferase
MTNQTEGIFARWNRRRRQRRVRHELKRLRRLPRYQKGSSDLCLRNIQYVDAASWAAQYDEIWRRGIYQLPEPESVRRILDCGANIGTATLFFATHFPQATIDAFEADPIVFEVLKQNCQQWNVNNVKLYNSAVWTESLERLRFASEGADSGCVIDSNQTTTHGIIEVSALALEDQIDGQVDLLKMDIEGAELVVLESCEAKLRLVKNLFVEYHSFVDRPQTLDRLLALLHRVGFRVHLDTPSVAKQPFVYREPFNAMDQYINVYAYRD